MYLQIVTELSANSLRRCFALYSIIQHNTTLMGFKQYPDKIYKRTCMSSELLDQSGHLHVLRLMMLTRLGGCQD